MVKKSILLLAMIILLMPQGDFSFLHGNAAKRAIDMQHYVGRNPTYFISRGYERGKLLWSGKCTLYVDFPFAQNYLDVKEQYHVYYQSYFPFAIDHETGKIPQLDEFKKQDRRWKYHRECTNGDGNEFLQDAELAKVWLADEASPIDWKQYRRSKGNPYLSYMTTRDNMDDSKYNEKTGIYINEDSEDKDVKGYFHLTTERDDAKKVFHVAFERKYDIYQFILYEYGDPPATDCNPIIEAPTVIASQRGQSLVAQPQGEIRSEGDQFDVARGIPTSEQLRAYGSASSFLYDHLFEQKRGKIVYTVKLKKTYILKWTEKETTVVKDQHNIEQTIETIVPKSDEETIEREYEVERPYSYWDISHLAVARLDSFTFQNYALPNGATTFSADNVVDAQAIQVGDYKRHVTPGTCKPPELKPETVTGTTKKPPIPNEDGEFKQLAEEAVKEPLVRNDKVEFQGQAIMSDEENVTDGQAPGSFPASSAVTASQGNMTIESTKENRANTPSSGYATYEELLSLNKSLTTTHPFAVNAVTVHTPVVLQADTSDEKEYDERVRPNMARKTLILKRNFTVQMPTSGPHLAQQGYGQRDYVKYVRSKEVTFPFDVFSTDRRLFYPAGEPIVVPVAAVSMTFYLPVWVKEGSYTVQFKTTAENAPPQASEEAKANLALANHVAVDTVPVDVVGRLYDFRVTDIADFNWETVFREQKGLPLHSGNYYWVGTNTIDGEPRGQAPRFTLPIRPGSHPLPTHRKVAVKTGYHFKYAVKTIGNLFGPTDGIKVTPTFSFVHRLGTLVPNARQPVDLYYVNEKKQLIQVGSPADRVQRSMMLNDRLRNVPADDLYRTGEYVYPYRAQYNIPEEAVYEHTFADQYGSKWAKRRYKIGGYAWSVVPSPLRTLIGPLSRDVPDEASVAQSEAVAHEQQWYGEYSVPADVLMVPKGTNLAAYARKQRGLTKRSPIFLKDGYLVVNFKIETVRGNVNEPYLHYYGNEGKLPRIIDQWRREGFATTITDGMNRPLPVETGDVLYYHANTSSYGDFRSVVTH